MRYNTIFSFISADGVGNPICDELRKVLTNNNTSPKSQSSHRSISSSVDGESSDTQSMDASSPRRQEHTNVLFPKDSDNQRLQDLMKMKNKIMHTVNVAAGSKEEIYNEPSVIRVRKVVNRGYDSDSSSSDSVPDSSTVSQRTESAFSGDYYSDSVRSSLRSSTSEVPRGHVDSHVSNNLNIPRNRSSQRVPEPCGADKQGDAPKREVMEKILHVPHTMEQEKVTKRAITRKNSSSSESDTDYDISRVHIKKSHIGKYQQQLQAPHQQEHRQQKHLMQQQGMPQNKLGKSRSREDGRKTSRDSNKISHDQSSSSHDQHFSSHDQPSSPRDQHSSPRRLFSSEHENHKPPRQHKAQDGTRPKSPLVAQQDEIQQDGGHHSSKKDSRRPDSRHQDTRQHDIRQKEIRQDQRYRVDRQTAYVNGSRACLDGTTQDNGRHPAQYPVIQDYGK